MRTAAWITLAAAVVCVATAEAQTSLYKWVDSEGKTHYTDTPPPPEVKNVQQKRLGGNAVGDDQLPYQTREAAKKNPVIMYTANDCASICADARNLLVARGIPYTEKNVSSNPKFTEELTKLEGRVDDLHDIGLKELFLKHRNANAMDFIVGVEIYDHLEKVADRFDDVANEINSIVIEQV